MVLIAKEIDGQMKRLSVPDHDVDFYITRGWSVPSKETEVRKEPVVPVKRGKRRSVEIENEE